MHIFAVHTIVNGSLWAFKGFSLKPVAIFKTKSGGENVFQNVSKPAKESFVANYQCPEFSISCIWKF